MNKVKPLKLKLDWATHKAADTAVKNWHYSKVMPTGKTVKIGVWEDELFTGVVIYSYGANNNSAKGFSLVQTEVCELTRVALRNHKTPVSKILSISLKMLKKANPGIRLVFSYSDLSNQGHLGTIYQANGWTYIGERKTSDKGAYYVINGKRMHGRSARAKYGSEKHFPKPWSHVPSMTKHLYVKVLDTTYDLKFKALPYPKHAPEAEATMRLSSTKEIDGSSPISALQENRVI